MFKYGLMSPGTHVCKMNPFKFEKWSHLMEARIFTELPLSRSVNNEIAFLADATVLNERNLLGGEVKIEDTKVPLHVLGARCSR